MPQGFEIIRARVKDDAVVLIDRLMRSRQTEVVLVLPKNSIVAADLNSLKTLKEEADSIGKILSLSSDNDKIISFAARLGMPIYNPNNYKESEKIEPEIPVKKIKIMTDIFPPSATKMTTEEDNASEEEPVLEEPVIEEPPVEEPIVVYETAIKNYDLEKNLENFYSSDDNYKNRDLKQKNKQPFFSLNRIIAFFVISGLVLFVITMYLVLPRASIKLSLKEVPLKAQIPVAVSKNVNSVNLDGGIIPGQYFFLNKTGSKTIDGDSKIGGVIEIYNAYSTAPQKLISQTRFETKDGKIFRTQSPVVVPGAKMFGTKLIPSSIKVNIVGDGTSDDYLIGPSYFTIPGFEGSPKYAGFYAKSTESMAKTASVYLSKNDLDKNKKELEDQLVQELKTDTLNTLKDSDLQLIDGAYAVSIDTFKVNADVLSMKITWQAILFKEKDLRNLINYFISSHFPDLKNFTFEDSITYPGASRADFKKGELFFTFNVDKNNTLPADVATLKKELAGQNENEMRTIISDKTYINSAAISLWPFWVKKAPNNTEKINITIDNK